MIGQIVGPYVIQSLLGSGGIGHVYAALDQNLDRVVALKALRPEYSDDPELVQRFRSEAANLARLNHPNITTLYSLHRESDAAHATLFMVMELVRGQTLETVLARSNGFDTRGCLAVVSQVIAGLSYAHRLGVIHRDIKPSNLMVTEDGLLKITDFGIARVQGSQRLTRQGAIVGTLAYIAPEQIKGSEGDERSDIYSLACVLYQLASKKRPFRGANEYELIRAQIEIQPEPLSTHAPDIDPRLEQAVMRALAKDPDDRFNSLEEFAEALGIAAVEGRAIEIIRDEVLPAQNEAIVPQADEASAGSDFDLPPLRTPPTDPGGVARGEVLPVAGAATPPRRWKRSAMAAGLVVVVATGGAAVVVRSLPGVAVAVQLQPITEGAAVHTTAAAPASAKSVLPEPDHQPAAAQPTEQQKAQAPQPVDPQQAKVVQPTNQLPAQAPANSEKPVQVADNRPTAPIESLRPATIPTDPSVVMGTVSSYSKDGWPIIDGHTIRLDGVDSLGPSVFKPITEWVSAHGNYLECTTVGAGGYRCITRQNLDLAQAILLNGGGRANTDATPAEREAEAEARKAMRGVWH